MTDSNDTCGYEDTTTGEPCKRAAGWGTDRDYGRCKDHQERGRPSKLSYERQENIASAVEDGDPLVAACRANGITHQTHRNWFKRGQEEDEGPYADYFERLARALAFDQSKKSKVLWETAEQRGDTQAMLTVLKQRYPETWEEMELGDGNELTISLEREVIGPD